MDARTLTAGPGVGQDIRRVATPFGEIAYVERGEGPVALFVHGVFLNGYFWRYTIDRVADIRRCIAIDLLAHGATCTTPDQDVSFSAQANMLEAFCDALKLGQVDLVGADSGGGIAQIFAARHPERIRSLVLTNCDTHDNWPPEAFRPTVELARQGRLGERGKRMLSDLEFTRAAFARSYEHPENVSAETFRIYLEPLYAASESARKIERFVADQDCCHTVAVEPLLRRLEAPTLIVWGTADIFFPLKWAYWLFDTIPGCRRVVTLEGAKLFFPEERPDEFASVLREHWLNAFAKRWRTGLQEASALLPESPGPRVARLFSSGTMRVALYAPAGVDSQRPHDQDEVYVVIRGSGGFSRGDEAVPFTAGDVLFVPAGMPHRFEDFTPDFTAWVIFYGPRAAASTSEATSRANAMHSA